MSVMAVFSCRNSGENQENDIKQEETNVGSPLVIDNPDDTLNPNCKYLELQDIEIIGILTFNSQRNPLVDWEDTISKGKVLIVCSKIVHESICENFDSFLSLKKKPEEDCWLSIYGHYMDEVDENLIYQRKRFYVHSATFYGENPPREMKFIDSF